MNDIDILLFAVSRFNRNKEEEDQIKYEKNSFYLKDKELTKEEVLVYTTGLSNAKLIYG